MALAYNELKPGTIIVLEGDPWEVKEYDFLRMQQRKPVVVIWGHHTHFLTIDCAGYIIIAWQESQES